MNFQVEQAGPVLSNYLKALSLQIMVSNMSVRVDCARVSGAIYVFHFRNLRSYLNADERHAPRAY